MNHKSVPGGVSSVEAEVYRALRHEITTLQLQPNQRLYLGELAGRYQVSPTPIRVALRRLERDGLVVSRARRGSLVAPLTVEELEEIQAHRMGLEGLLARSGALGCTEAAIEAMESWLQRVDQAAADHDWEGHLRAQWSLRDACYVCARAPHLSRELEEQRGRAERYVRFLSRDVETVAEARKFELQLLEACRRRDGEAAGRSSYDAQHWALQHLSALLRQQPAAMTAAEESIDPAGVEDDPPAVASQFERGAGGL